MSCVGLANTSTDALPDQWFCWYCKPDKFEWVRSRASPSDPLRRRPLTNLTVNGTSGDTLATSLGISQTHWNPAYVQSQTPTPLDSSRPATSTLRISNLLSPAPSSFPPPSVPKILLDPLKAKRIQEQRFIKNDRLRKHMEATGGASMPPGHGRKASLAHKPKPKPVPGLGTLPSTPTAEAGPSTPAPKRKTSATATTGTGAKKPRILIPDAAPSTNPMLTLVDPRSRSPSGDVEMRSSLPPPPPRVFSNGLPLTQVEYFPHQEPPRTPAPLTTPDLRTPSPPPIPRPPHPLTTGLGAGAPIGVPKGTGTGTAISRPPKPLALRSFPTSNPGLAVFLDPSATPSIGETNAVVRPLVCHVGEGLGFAVFALKEVREGDPIVLGWEILDRAGIEPYVPFTDGPR